MRRRRRWAAALCAVAAACATAPAASAALSRVDAPSAAAGEQKIPFKREEDGALTVLVRVVGGLAVVVVVGIAAVYLLKRYFPSLYHPTFAGSTRIKLLEARRLTPKTTLFLIELDGTLLLLGQSSDRITTLHERPKTSTGGHDG